MALASLTSLNSLTSHLRKFELQGVFLDEELEKLRSLDNTLITYATPSPVIARL